MSRVEISGRGTWRIIHLTAVAASAPADTNENAVYTRTIPGNSMGPNGALKVDPKLARTSSVNDVTWRVYYGGGPGVGTKLFEYLSVSHTSQKFEVTIQNRNSLASQIGGQASGASGGVGAVNAAWLTATVDSSVDQDLVITAQKETGSETATIESIIVQAAYGV